MQIDDMDRGWLEHIQRISNETMTRVIFYDSEIVSSVEHERILIVEPLSMEITADA